LTSIISAHTLKASAAGKLTAKNNKPLHTPAFTLPQERGEGSHRTRMPGIDTAKASVVGQKHKKERFYLISFEKNK